MANVKKEVIFFWGALIVCLSVSAILISAAVVPWTKNWIAMKHKLSQRQTELAQRYNTAEENKRLARQISEIGATYGDFNAMFFTLNDMSAQAVKEFARISQDLQIQYSTFSPGEPQKIETLSTGIGFDVWEAQVTLKLKTSFAKLVDFLSRIENSGKFIRIKDFRISKSAGNVLMRDADLTVSIYSLQKKELPQE